MEHGMRLWVIVMVIMMVVVTVRILLPFICADGYCDDKDLPLWQLVKHSVFINPRKFPALFCSRAELVHSPLSVEIVFAK